MDIQTASMNLSQANVREEVGMRLEAMSLRSMEEQSAKLNSLLKSAQVVSDPNLGTTVDISV